MLFDDGIIRLVDVNTLKVSAFVQVDGHVRWSARFLSRFLLLLSLSLFLWLSLSLLSLFCVDRRFFVLLLIS